MIEYYDKNGQLEERRSYKKGTLDCVVEVFYEGQLNQRVNYKNGKLDGLCESFAEGMGVLIIRSYYKKGKKDGYEDSSGWYNLKKDEKLQYKIQGPMKIRILTRSVYSEELINYSLIINEDGRLQGNFLYNIIRSRKGAHYLLNNEKINVSNYKMTYLNVPDGIHYYSMKTSEEEDQEILVKLQSAMIE